jgi:DNA-binding ferritin-like protein
VIGGEQPADVAGEVPQEPAAFSADEALASLDAVEAADPSGRCAKLMWLVSLLAETGVSRRLIHLAASSGVLGAQATAADADTAAGQLADASLLVFAPEDSVRAHRLVMRVVRERLTANNEMALATAAAVLVLHKLEGEIAEASRSPGDVRELAGHLAALNEHAGGYADAFGRDLLRLRERSVSLLNDLGDSPGLAVLAGESLAAESLAADGGRVPGADHLDTLKSREHAAVAYQAAGRTAAAIRLREQTVSDYERVLGTDHPDTLKSRDNLAAAYQAAERSYEAIVLLQQTLADRERVLGTDHPDTLRSRDSLATALQAAGRTVEAKPLLERTLADYERVLGTGHPDTIASRERLAAAYEAARRDDQQI